MTIAILFFFLIFQVLCELCFAIDSRINPIVGLCHVGEIKVQSKQIHGDVKEASAH